MRKKRNCILTGLITVCAFSSATAFAGCDRESTPQKFGIEDRWVVSGNANLGQARFTKACDELISCYETANSAKRSCDRDYARSLKVECAKTFKFHPDALVRCNRVTDTAIELVEEKAGGIYRKGQRLAKAARRAEARKKRTEARRDRATERRKRRLDWRKEQDANAQ